MTTVSCLGTGSTEVTVRPGGPKRPADTATGVVTSITDGDTIEVDVNGQTMVLRLIGLNAPERGECLAEESTTYLADLLASGSVGVESVSIDQFGRTLANVWSEDTLVNLDLVDHGMAIAQTPDEDNPYGVLMTASEKDAYERSVGIWSPTACSVEPVSRVVAVDLGLSDTNPAGPDETVLDDEFIVLVNNGSDQVDMSNWTLRDESSRNRLVFPEGTSMAPGETLRISSGCSTEPAWCGNQPIWNNGGDLVLLLDQTGTVIARSRY